MDLWDGCQLFVIVIFHDVNPFLTQIEYKSFEWLKTLNTVSYFFPLFQTYSCNDNHVKFCGNVDSYVGINLIIPSSNRTRDSTNSVRLRVTVVYHLNIQNRKRLLLCYPQSIYIILHAYVALIQGMTNPKLSDLTKLKLILVSYLSNLIGQLGFFRSLLFHFCQHSCTCCKVLQLFYDLMYLC